jgi:hypothetical protein
LYTKVYVEDILWYTYDKATDDSKTKYRRAKAKEHVITSKVD